MEQKKLILMILFCFLLISEGSESILAKTNDLLFARKSSIFPDRNAGSNTIIGMVTDPEGMPISRIYVELQNEVNSVISRKQTDDVGRFTFSYLSSGTFTIRIITAGTNYAEYSESVAVGNFSGLNSGSGMFGAGDNQYVDIRLSFDKKKLKIENGTVTEVIFAQSDIPEPAQKSYEKGVQYLSKGDEKGIAELTKAIDLFPTYFLALNRLAIEYIKRGKNEDSLPLLIRAIDVNQKSYQTYYALGLVCYKLKHRKEALEAIKAALIINQESINALLLRGTIESELRYDKEAETSLVKAKELSKKNPVAEIHYQLALVYNHLNRNAEAAKELETYLKLQPDTPIKEKVQGLIAQLKKG